MYACVCLDGSLPARQLPTRTGVEAMAGDPRKRPASIVTGRGGPVESSWEISLKSYGRWLGWLGNPWKPRMTWHSNRKNIKLYTLW